MKSSLCNFNKYGAGIMCIVLKDIIIILFRLINFNENEKWILIFFSQTYVLKLLHYHSSSDNIYSIDKANTFSIEIAYSSFTLMLEQHLHELPIYILNYFRINCYTYKQKWI